MRSRKERENKNKPGKHELHLNSPETIMFWLEERFAGIFPSSVPGQRPQQILSQVLGKSYIHSSLSEVQSMASQDFTTKYVKESLMGAGGQDKGMKLGQNEN